MNSTLSPQQSNYRLDPKQGLVQDKADQLLAMGVPLTRRQIGPVHGFGASEVRFITKNFDVDGITGPTRTQRQVPGAGAYEVKSSFYSVKRSTDNLDTYQPFALRKVGRYNPAVDFDPQIIQEKKQQNMRRSDDRHVEATKSVPLKAQVYRHETSWGSMNFTPKWEARRPSPLLPYTQIIPPSHCHLPPQGSHVVYTSMPTGKLGRFSDKLMRERSRKEPPRPSQKLLPKAARVPTYNQSPPRTAPNSLFIEQSGRSIPKLKEELERIKERASAHGADEEMPSVEFPQVEWPQVRGFGSPSSEVKVRTNPVTEAAAWHPNPIPKKWS